MTKTEIRLLIQGNLLSYKKLINNKPKNNIVKIEQKYRKLEKNNLKGLLL